jgi:hypothetical protein
MKINKITVPKGEKQKHRASDCANVVGCYFWENDACWPYACSDFKLKEVKK